VAAGLALVRFVGGGSPVGEVFVVDAAGDFHQLTGLGSASSLGASLPVWSPDGRQVAFGPPKVGAGSDRFLSVFGADGSGERPLAALGDEFGLPFGWSRVRACCSSTSMRPMVRPCGWLMWRAARSGTSASASCRDGCRMGTGSASSAASRVETRLIHVP
jgi:hypothetical protein